MMDTEKRDADLEDIRKRLGGLKFRYNLLIQFREFGSQACENKLYETKCKATVAFFSLNVADFFDTRKTSVVMVANGRSERRFNADDSAQMSPKNKFFLLYALGFNNLLAFQEETVLKLNQLRRSLELNQLLTEEISERITAFDEYLQGAFIKLKKEHEFFDKQYDQMSTCFGAKHTIQSWSIRECGQIYKLFYSRALFMNGVELFQFIKATVIPFNEQIKKTAPLGKEFDAEEIVKDHAEEIVKEPIILSEPISDLRKAASPKGGSLVLEDVLGSKEPTILSEPTSEVASNRNPQRSDVPSEQKVGVEATNEVTTNIQRSTVQSEPKAGGKGAKDQAKQSQPSAVQSMPKAVVAGVKDPTERIQPSAVPSEQKVGVEATNEVPTNIQRSAVQSEPKAGGKGAKDQAKQSQPSDVQSMPKAVVAGVKDNTERNPPSAVPSEPNAGVEATTELRTNMEPSSAVKSKSKERGKGSQDQVHLSDEDIPRSGMETTSKKRSLVVDDDDNEPEVGNFVDDDDDNLQDTDEENEPKSRSRRVTKHADKFDTCQDPKNNSDDMDTNTRDPDAADRNVGPDGVVVDSIDGSVDEENKTAGNGDQGDESVVRSSRKRKRDINAGVVDDADCGKTSDDDDADCVISNTSKPLEDFEFGYLKLDQVVLYEGSNDSVATFNGNDRIHECLMNLLDKKFEIATLEFQLSMEMILRYTQYQQPFWQFLLMCEAISVEFAEKKLIEDPTKDFLIMRNFASSQLDNMSWNMMTFIKKYVASKSLLETQANLQMVFPAVNGQLLDKYSLILSHESVSKAISNVSRDDDLFMRLTKSKCLKDARLELMSALATAFCRDKRSFLDSKDKSIKADIQLVLKNIHSIGSKVTTKVIKEVQELLVTYVSDDVVVNPFPRPESGSEFLVHSRKLRPPKEGAPVNYENSCNSSNKKSRGSVKAVQSEPKAGGKGAKDQAKQSQPSAVQSKPKAVVAGAKDQTRRIQPSAVSSEPKAVVVGAKDHAKQSQPSAVQSMPKAVVVGAKDQTGRIQPSAVPSEPKAGVEAANEVTTNIQPSAVPSEPQAVVEATNELTTNIELSVFQSEPKAGVEAAKQLATNIEPSVVQSDPKAGVEAAKELATNIELSSTVKSKSKERGQGSQDQVLLSDEDIPHSGMDITNEDPMALFDKTSAFRNFAAIILESLSKTSGLNAQEVKEAASLHLQYLIQLCEINGVNFDEIVANVKLQRCSTTDHAFSVETSETVGIEEGLEMEVDNNEISLDGVGQADELNDKEEREVQVVNSAELEIFTSSEVVLYAYFPFATNLDVDDNRLFHEKIRIITVTRREDWLCSCVLTMFAHALRIHLMTTSLSVFDRSTHEFVYDLLSENRTFEHFLELFGHGDYTDYVGPRRLSLIIDHLLGKHYRNGNIQLNYLQSSIVIMRSTSSNTATADVVEFNQMIAEKILESLNAESSINIDPSLIFIDIGVPSAETDSSTKYLSFPNRIMIKYPDKTVVYQSVAALYKCIFNGKDHYMFRIVTRHKRNFGASYVMLELPYVDGYDQNIAEYPYEELDSSTGSKTTFPAVCKRKGKAFCLDGIILCLNKGQGILTSQYSDNACAKASAGKKNVVTEDQLVTRLLYSLSDEEKVGSYAEQHYTIRIEEMKILKSQDSWFTDEILNVAMTRVISSGPAIFGFLHRSDVIADVSVIRQLINAVAADSVVRQLSKAVADVSVADAADVSVADAADVASAYEQSKRIWNYQNIFTLNSWFHTILNYPENSHWIFVGINAASKIIFIVDSMWTESKSKLLLEIVKIYIRLEHSSCIQTPDPIIGDFVGWSIHNSGNSPQQDDMNNCGVHAILAFLSLYIQTGANGSSISTAITFHWPQTKELLKEYRSLIQNMFFDETIGSSLRRLKELFLLPQSDSGRRLRKKPT